MQCSGSPPAQPEILWGKLPVDNSECGSCLGALGPWLTSGIICAGAGELLGVSSPAPLQAAFWCLLSWILRKKKKKKEKKVVFSVAVIIWKYSDGDKMLFQLPLVNINSRRSISQEDKAEQASVTLPVLLGN